jgi:hypothetical protein
MTATRQSLFNDKGTLKRGLDGDLDKYPRRISALRGHQKLLEIPDFLVGGLRIKRRSFDRGRMAARAFAPKKRQSASPRQLLNELSRQRCPLGLELPVNLLF